MTMTTTPAASAPVRVSADVLRPWAARMLQAGGMSADNAAQVADALVWADLRGTGSHGVSRLPLYLQWLASGEMAGHAEPKTITRLPALVVIDGQGGAGAVGMHSVVDAVVDGAKKAGACVGLLKATTHTGALGYFTSHIARQGMVGLAMATSGPLMAYHGAAESGLSTAPLSIAAPGASADAAPILFDMASSAVAMGKLMQARAAGKPLEAGWAIDEHGEPTLDAAKAKVLLPLGGPKGSGLALMAEVVCSLLTANPILSTSLAVSPSERKHQQNAFVLAIDIAQVTSLEQFHQDMAALVGAIKQLPAAGSARILMPGERGEGERLHRVEEGGALAAPVVGALGKLALEFGVDVPWSLG